MNRVLLYHKKIFSPKSLEISFSYSGNILPEICWSECKRNFKRPFMRRWKFSIFKGNLNLINNVFLTWKVINSDNFYCIVVNRALLSLHWGSLKTMLRVPLILRFGYCEECRETKGICSQPNPHSSPNTRVGHCWKGTIMVSLVFLWNMHYYLNFQKMIPRGIFNKSVFKKF